MSDIKEILSKYKKIAMIGVSNDPTKASTIVMKYMQKYGFKVLSINTDNARTLNKVKPFVNSQNYSFPVLLDPNSSSSVIEQYLTSPPALFFRVTLPLNPKVLVMIMYACVYVFDSGLPSIDGKATRPLAKSAAIPSLVIVVTQLSLLNVFEFSPATVIG